MSAAIEEQVALAVLAQLTRGPRVERLATHLRWRLQWESAYMAEQTRLVAGQSPGPEPVQTPSTTQMTPPQPIAEQQLSTPPHSSEENSPRNAASHVPEGAVNMSPPGSVLSSTHAVTLGPLAQAPIGRVVSPTGPAARSQPPAAAHTQRLVPMLEPYPENAVRVEWVNGGVRLLIRDPDLQPRVGLSVTARVRSALAGSGVQLTDVFLNGELLWREDAAAREGKPRLSEEQGHAIDEIY